MYYKNFIIGLTAISVAYSANADAYANAIKVIWFEVDGINTYQVSGCVPGSQVAYYSNVTGGKLLKSFTADAMGNTITEADKDFKPAFALNVKTAGTSGISGNGMVSFTGSKEFALNDIKLQAKGAGVMVDWNAAVTNPQVYHFEILKSVNGSNFEKIGTVEPSSTNMSAYSFTDNLGNGDAVYTLRVTGSNGVTYTSLPMAAAGAGDVSVFPTITHSLVNVRLNGGLQSGKYRMVNSEGQTVQSGTLPSEQTQLNLGSLPSGNYIIQIEVPGKTVSARIVKQ